jgi:hypothetical protein
VNRDLVIDTSWYQIFSDQTGKVSSRKPELSYFPELRKLQCIVLKRPYWDRRLGQAFRRLPDSAKEYFGYYTDSIVNKNSNFKNIRTLDGNFESIDLLPADSDLIKLLKFPDLNSNWLDANQERVGPDVLAIHVRMGDYKNLPEIYGFLTPDYYTQALTRIRNSREVKRLILFSDDTTAAREWLSGKIKFDDIIDSAQSINSGDTLQLMSKAGAIITAHSTFSWWAAKIGVLNGTCKEVALPSRFLSYEAAESSRLQVKSWHIITV